MPPLIIIIISNMLLYDQSIIHATKPLFIYGLFLLHNKLIHVHRSQFYGSGGGGVAVFSVAWNALHIQLMPLCATNDDLFYDGK